ncbi:hypothetical protein BP5796_10194 [Coleophoma crateriformis]|uniref:Enoyl reductase (ER) domain-containing protein n=1 Tax=Coleophoma crateriformis TaxID=565419 RepID=A0A3D8QUR2_9HELO|nr:hypothetical protein BP5796_10194 [Coleophoma crateriformis]
MSALLCGIPQFLARRKSKAQENTAYLEGVPVQNEKKTVVSAKVDPFDSASSSASTIAIPPTTAVKPAEKAPETKSQRALTVCSKGKYALVDDFPAPELQHEQEVVIRNYAVGLNPIDWKSVDYNFCLPAFPWVTGREMAGVVERVGSEVKGCKVGDRVWTSTYYRDARAGCFQELVTVPAHTVSHIPSNITFEEAACLGVAALTAGMTLWKWLDVPLPSAPAVTSEEYLLVWGGSAVTGQFAIQMAKLGGLNVIAVCSERTKSMTEELGAKVVTRDGKSNEEIIEELRSIAGENITRVIDLVGNSTAVAALKTVSKTKPVHFAPLAMMKDQVVEGHITVHTVEMKRFVLDEESDKWSQELNALIESGKLRLPKIEVMNGGLEAVEAGLERIKKGDMGGVKVVVSLA